MAGRLPLAWLAALALCACGYDDGQPDAGRPGSGGRPGLASDGAPAGGGEVVPACQNGLDDDCDGITDFSGGDPGCALASDDDERGTASACDDGIDNDDDGLVDYVSPDCGDSAADTGCTGPTDSSELDGPGPF